MYIVRQDKEYKIQHHQQLVQQDTHKYYLADWTQQDMHMNHLAEPQQKD
jgi:hypothetical protein